MTWTNVDLPSTTSRHSFRDDIHLNIQDINHAVAIEICTVEITATYPWDNELSKRKIRAMFRQLLYVTDAVNPFTSLVYY